MQAARGPVQRIACRPWRSRASSTLLVDGQSRCIDSQWIQRASFSDYVSPARQENPFKSEQNLPRSSRPELKGKSKKPEIFQARAETIRADGRRVLQITEPVHVRRARTEQRSLRHRARLRKMSLVDQLFPEHAEKVEPRPEDQRESMKQFIDPATLIKPATFPNDTPIDVSPMTDLDIFDKRSRVLYVQSASLNLTEEDFRRLRPPQTHGLGWAKENNEIVKVVPGRELETLSRENFYYLIFKSPSAAARYREHVLRLHKVVKDNIASETSNPIPPTPEAMAGEVHIQSALDRYTLMPSNQRLNIGQLEKPLTPLVEAILRHEGYPALMKRKYKSPFEVRLTLHGLQVALDTLYHFFLKDGKKRGMGWGGDRNFFGVDITCWTAHVRVSPWSRSPAVERALFKDERSLETGADQEMNSFADHQPLAADAHAEVEPSSLKPWEKHDAIRRTPNPVFIVGFKTEDAAQAFLHHWHMRPLQVKSLKEVDYEDPPIAHVEMLW